MELLHGVRPLHCFFPVETDCIFIVFESVQSKVPKAEKTRCQPIPFADLINVSPVFDSLAGMHGAYKYLSRIPQLYTLLLSFRSNLLANIESVNYVLTVTSEGLLSFINDYQCLERLIGGLYLELSI